MIARLIIMSFILLPVTSYGQFDMLYLLKNNYQRSYLNPSMVSDNRIILSLPSFSLDYNSSSLTINDFLSDSDIPGVKNFDFDNAYTQVNDNNHIYSRLKLDYGNLFVRFGNLGLGIGGSFNVTGQSAFKDDLIGLLAKGNGEFIGKTLDIGPNIIYQSYNELYLNVAFQLGNIKLGVRGKVLNGVQDVSTSKSQILLTTDPEIYEVTLENDYVLNTSALAAIDGLDNIEFDFKNFSLNNLLTNNFGFAFDLGLSMPLGEKNELGISITDVGSIAWDRRNKNYTSSGIEGFSGLNLVDYIGNSEDIIIEDSLYEIMNFKESSSTYSTSLPWNINASFVRSHSENINLGASVRYGKYNGTNHTIASVFGSYDLLKWLTLGTSINYRNGNFSNLGLFSNLSLGPFEGFIATDNIFGFIKPLDTSTANIRMGGHFNILSKKTVYAKIDENIELK